MSVVSNAIVEPCPICVIWSRAESFSKVSHSKRNVFSFARRTIWSFVSDNNQGRILKFPFFLSFARIASLATANESFVRANFVSIDCKVRFLWMQTTQATKAVKLGSGMLSYFKAPKVKCIHMQMRVLALRMNRFKKSMRSDRNGPLRTRISMLRTLYDRQQSWMKVLAGGRAQLIKSCRSQKVQERIRSQLNWDRPITMSLPQIWAAGQLISHTRHQLSKISSTCRGRWATILSKAISRVRQTPIIPL